MKKIISLIAASIAIGTANAQGGQGCQDTGHSVKSLPYWNSSQAFPCMYAGPLKSNSDGSHNLFYWLFRDPNRSSNSQFTIWLNGGPGATSMFGLFGENGPLRVARNGSGSDDFVIGTNQEGGGSWFDIGDILFIDQPVGTGFSFGNSYLTTMSQAGDEFITFLTNFLQMYPDYAGTSRALTLSGESYAGKYIPYFAARIQDSKLFNL